MEIKVFVVKPDLISDFPWGEAGVYVVLHKKGSFFMGSNGSFPSFRENVEVFF